MESRSEVLRSAAYDLIYLCGCGVNGISPARDRIERMDLESVHSLSRSLSLSALAYTAAESAYDGNLPDTDLFKEWEREKDFSVYRNFLFEIEKEKVTSFLTENKAWHAPLKGIIIEKLYPEAGMREMCDADILYDDSFCESLHTWFLERGYESKVYKKGNVDSYLKKPVYNFEMHRSLFAPPHDKKWIDYYGNIKDRLIPDPSDPFDLHFSDDDFYIYLTTHIYKHFRNGGTGLRSLLDFYVFLNSKRDNLDPAYISSEFKKLGIENFAERSASCAEKIFSDPENFSASELSEEEKEFVEYFLFSGTYGTKENSIRNKVRSIAPDEKDPSVETKLKYIWRRLFPDPEVMDIYYPFFEHKWQYPIGYTYRAVYRVFTKWKNITAELRLVRKL